MGEDKYGNHVVADLKARAQLIQGIHAPGKYRINVGPRYVLLDTSSQARQGTGLAVPLHNLIQQVRPDNKTVTSI